MLSLSLPASPKVLCLGCHADDIEIGCGGTLLQWAEELGGLETTWLVLSGDEVRRGEQEESSSRYFERLGGGGLRMERFADARFPEQYDEIKGAIREVGSEFNPDLILTHALHDRHQDHRLVAELTWNVFRDHLVLEYEVPKYEGDLQTPQCYVPISAANVETKVQWLDEVYGSQRNKHWFDADLFRGLMRLRGSESRSATRFAEGFHVRKWCLGHGA